MGRDIVTPCDDRVSSVAAVCARLLLYRHAGDVGKCPKVESKWPCVGLSSRGVAPGIHTVETQDGVMLIA